MQYLYSDDQFYYFMNTETTSRSRWARTRFGDANKYLKENDICQLVLYGDEVIGIELPMTVDTDGRADGPRPQGRHRHRRHQAGHARTRASSCRCRCS